MYNTPTAWAQKPNPKFAFLSNTDSLEEAERMYDDFLKFVNYPGFPELLTADQRQDVASALTKKLVALRNAENTVTIAPEAVLQGYLFCAEQWVSAQKSKKAADELLGIQAMPAFGMDRHQPGMAMSTNFIKFLDNNLDTAIFLDAAVLNPAQPSMAPA